jgi:hypothetical protein
VPGAVLLSIASLVERPIFGVQTARQIRSRADRANYFSLSSGPGLHFPGISVDISEESALPSAV